MFHTNSLKKNGVFNAIKTLMSVLFPLITFPYASRILGPSGIGKVNFASSIVSYFLMLAMLGISNYGIREAGRYRNDKEKLSKFVKEILSINLISSVIAYTFLFASIYLVPAFFEYRKLIIISSASILFTVVGVEWLFYAMEDLVSVSIRSFIFQILSLVLLFVFVRTSEDYINYALIGVVSSVGSNILSFIFASRYVDFKSKNIIELKQHLKPIFVFFMMSVAATVNSSIDITMLGFISGADEVGYYSAALKVVRLVAAVVASFTVILPRLSYYASAGENENFKILSTKTLDANMLLAIPACIGMMSLSKNIIYVLSGTQYENSIRVLHILSFTVFLLTISNLCGAHMLLALGKEKVTFYAVLIGIFFNIATNLILIKRYGAYGAGIATLASEFTVSVIEFFCVKKYFICKDILKNLFQTVCSALIMALIVFAIIKTDFPIITSLVLSIFAGTFSYFIVLLILRNELLYEFVRRMRWSK